MDHQVRHDVYDRTPKRLNADKIKNQFHIYISLIFETSLYMSHYQADPMEIETTLIAVQTLGQKPAYRISESYGLLGSRPTAYRVISRLQELGFAEFAKRGYFTLRTSAFQPYWIWPHLLPSLRALKQAKYFGRAYDESDVKYVRKRVEGIETLDYRAYELTQLQTPYTLSIYVDNPEQIAEELKSKRFSEGRKGRIAILPKEGEYKNEIQRLYLDCLASGGRSILDAIAIELLYGDQLQIKGEFPVELVIKVREDLPRR